MDVNDREKAGLIILLQGYDIVEHIARKVETMVDMLPEQEQLLA